MVAVFKYFLKKGLIHKTFKQILKRFILLTQQMHSKTDTFLHYRGNIYTAQMITESFYIEHV